MNEEDGQRRRVLLKGSAGAYETAGSVALTFSHWRSSETFSPEGPGLLLPFESGDRWRGQEYPRLPGFAERPFL